MTTTMPMTMAIRSDRVRFEDGGAAATAAAAAALVEVAEQLREPADVAAHALGDRAVRGRAERAGRAPGLGGERDGQRRVLSERS